MVVAGVQQLRSGLLALAPSLQEASIPARLCPKHASLPKAGLDPHPPALRPGAELGKTTDAPLFLRNLCLKAQLLSDIVFVADVFSRQFPHFL